MNKILKKILNYEKHLIVNNNQEVLDFLNNNNINKLQTYDFENLFTSIPHGNLINICSEIYDYYLTGENIVKDYWMELCRVNIFENYLFNGVNFYRQIKGISMGISYSSAFANIFLHYHEKLYLLNHEVFGFRYIDDLLIYGDIDFDTLNNIYISELKLLKTNELDHSVNYLDLSVKIIDNRVIIGLYDKRKDFNFRVITLCNFYSNLYFKIFKNVVFNQFNRIKKICNNEKLFSIAIKDFLNCLRENNYPFNYGNINSLVNASLKNYSSCSVDI